MGRKLAVGDYAIIRNTTDLKLDGQIVRILGDETLKTDGVYIIGLNPPVDGQEAIQLVSGCLEEVIIFESQHQYFI